jgi:hypothetical protein
MKKVPMVEDYNGLEVMKGDTVATLSDGVTARVCDLAKDEETGFVCLRPLHSPFSKGIWHAADRVQRISVGKRE